MSEPIPESIPTSHDPRSRRPTKKRALSPRSQTAASITTLFAAPEKALLSLPTSALTTTPHLHAPPEIVQNVQGSSAGAGSGEFHVYKASRRREYERVKGMEEEVAREAGDAKWEREMRERRERDEERTRKRREKRGKMKGKKGAVGEEGKEGKVKPRVQVREGADGLGGEGSHDRDGGEAGTNVVEEVGVIIHDDD